MKIHKTLNQNNSKTQAAQESEALKQHPCPNAKERRNIINWLKHHKYPVLPVAPAQPADKYPSIKKGVIQKDKAGNPIPAFTGKNPSYLDRNGTPHLVQHWKYQNRLPSDRELNEWFANSLNGIGTLGGWNDTVWLDFDVKQFPSEEDCTQAVTRILENLALTNTFLDRSHSGGWRVGIRVEQKPEFTNFALSPGGQHVGEALFKGRFTVLAPTIGVSGNPYQSINRVMPVEVSSLESIGIYPTSAKKAATRSIPQADISYIPGNIPLEMLGTDISCEILNGSCPTGDRSEALATAVQEWYGWQNWANQNGVSVSGTPEDLAHYAGTQLGLDSDRVTRILKTIDPTQCHPAALHRGDEESCWKKVRRLDKATFEANCPAHIKERIKSEFSEEKRKSDRKNGSVAGDSQVVVDSQDVDTASIAATVTTVTEILKSGYLDWEENHKLEAVRVNSELNNKQAFSALVNAMKTQLDEVQPEDEVRLQSLIDWHNAELDFDKALPSMAADIQHDAKILNIDPIGIWQYLFPAVLSLAGKRVDLDVESHTIPAIAWTAILAESGTGKTRAEKLVTAPLKQLQKAARERFKAELEEWEDWEGEGDDKKPPKPVERKYLFDVATIQAVMRRQSEQGKNGSLWARDELLGVFQSFGQFSKNGESEALSCLLASWDGGGSQVDRVNQEDSYFIEASRLSIAGGLQPGVFKKAFKDPNDSQGLQARFLFASMKPRKPKRTKGFCHLSEELPQMYQWLDNLPEGKIKLSKAADAYYERLYEEIGEQAINTSMPAIRAWMFKLPGQLLRIALALHLIECYYEPDRPFWELQKDTLERAVLFAQYYRSTFHIVQTTTANTDDISAILLKIWDKAVTRHPEGISTRDAYREIKAIQSRAKDAGRPVCAYTADLFAKLEQMGKGTVVKKGRQVKFVAVLNPPPISPIGDGDSTTDTDPPGDRVTEAENLVKPMDTTVTPNEVSPGTVTRDSHSITDEISDSDATQVGATEVTPAVASDSVQNPGGAIAPKVAESTKIELNQRDSEESELISLFPSEDYSPIPPSNGGFSDWEIDSEG